MATVARQVGFLLIGYRNPDTDQPLELGEVYTYLDGTSTKSALWTDRDKSANANNPITLDSQGRAEVYGDNVYKFEIYEQRNDDDTIGAHVETINGIDLFATSSSEVQWSVQETDVITYASATSFTVINDVTSKYEAGRRIRAEGTTTGTIYGTITSSSYAGGTNKTTVNVTWDSGGLNNESLEIALGILTVTEPSMPRPLTKTVTAATTLTYTDYGKTVLVDYSGSSFDITLPAHSDGWWVKFIVIDATNSGNINDNGGTAQLSLNAVGEAVFLISDGSLWRTKYIPSIPTGGGSNGEILETDGSGFSFVEPDNRYAPATHASTHQDGNSDELDAADLSGAGGTGGQIIETDGSAFSYVEPDGRYIPNSHASIHKDGGSDELDAAELAGALGTADQILRTNGAAASWQNFEVAQGDLKTSTGSVSTVNTTGDILTLPGGEYGFYPQIKNSGGAYTFWGGDPTVADENSTAATTSTSYVTSIILRVAGNTGYARQRYVTASGEVYWIFILWDKTTKQVISTYQAPDHPCFGNGGDPEIVPHPFPGFDVYKHEILVINPSLEFMKNVYDKTPKGRDLLETLFAENDIDDTVNPGWTRKKVTVDVRKNDFPFAAEKEKAEVAKRTIPKPKNVKTAGLKAK